MRIDRCVLQTACGWLVCLAAVVPAALADGVYISEQAVKTKPAIPQQRALIVFGDGRETLIIESMLDGDGQSFGWIIPVPAVPTKVETSTPGVLATLSRNLQPEIRHDLTRQLSPWLWIGAWVLFCVVYILTGDRTARQVVWTSVAVGLFLFLIAGMLLPTLGRAGAPQPDRGVVVHAESVIGNYSVITLSARDAGTLNTWLTDNGFQQLPPAGESIAAAYIAEGWHFVAAKLRRPGNKPATPHPIALTFPAKTPVYPMRLTALTGTPVYLELFVAADRAVEADSEKLVLEYSDHFAKRNEAYRDYGVQSLAQGDLLIPRTFLRRGRQRLALGHPGLTALIPDGAAITKLSGTLDPADMARDITLLQASGEPFRKAYYSRRGARHRGLCTGLALCCSSLLVLFVVLWRQYRTRGPAFGVAAIVLPAIALGVVAGIIHYAALEKVEVTALKHPWKEAADVRAGYAQCMNTLVREKRITAASTREEVEKQFISVTADFRQRNPDRTVSGSFRHEDSPYNWIVIEDDGGVVFHWFDANGIPIDTAIAAAVQPDEEP